MNLRLGRWSQALARGYGWCGRCGTPWRFVEPHVTNYGSGGRGVLVLCERCWGHLPPAQRLPYYYAWHRRWRRWEDDDTGSGRWWLIAQAVRSGR